MDTAPHRPTLQRVALFHGLLPRQHALALHAQSEDRHIQHCFGKIFKNVWLGLDAFNLLGIKNVNSYYWVTDISNTQYAVPNYLTGLQINGRITMQF